VSLPIQYNPDARGKRKLIPAELLRLTEDELLDHFAQEGLSFEFVSRTRTYGEWKGIEDEILLIKIEVKMKAPDPAWLNMTNHHRLLAQPKPVGYDKLSVPTVLRVCFSDSYG